MSNRDRPLRTGFGNTPNALWTLPTLTYAERCLLGWLHSHADDYRVRLSKGRVASEFGAGRDTVWNGLDKLAALGFINLVPPFKPGGSAGIVVLSGPWEALMGITHPVQFLDG